MMTQRELKFFVVVAAAAVVAGLASSTAHAGFVDQLEGLQLAKGAIHQYRFEGADLAARQDDNGSLGVDLRVALGEGGTGANDVNATPGDTSDDVPWSYPAGTAGDIIFEAGYDSSQAYRPKSVPATSTFAAEVLAQRRSGAGLYSPTFTTPSMMTIEAIVKPGAYNDVSGGSLHYIIQTRPGTGRGYYLAQQQPDGSRGTNGSLVAAIGNPLTPLAGRPRIVGDHSDQSHWYYVAATYDLSGANAVISSWFADLTAGGPLTQSQNNTVFTEAISTLVGLTGNAGIGLFSRNTDLNMDGINDAQEFFNGSLDNLTIFNKKLTAADILQSYRALTVPGVPEPASFALLGLGAVLACGPRRRSS